MANPFISKYGGNAATNQSGLASLNKALASGMTISQINNSGVSWGPAAAAELQKRINSANSSSSSSSGRSSGPWFPEGYSSYNDWLSDDNYTGELYGSWDEPKNDIVYNNVAPTQQAQQAPAGPPAKTPEQNFNDRLAQIMEDNQKNTAALTASMQADRDRYADLDRQNSQRMENFMNSFNSQLMTQQQSFNKSLAASQRSQSAYSTRSNLDQQGAGLTINPVKGNKDRTSKGTGQFDRNLRISNVKI